MVAQNATAAEARDLAFLRREEERVAEAARFLVPHLSEAQQDRYEAYRRAGFKDTAIRRVIGAVTDATVHKQAALAVRTAAKMFVGDIVEEARALMDERGETGAIRPWHVREAYAKLQEQGKAPVIDPPLMPRAFSAKRNVI
jgi:histone H3/H4